MKNKRVEDVYKIPIATGTPVKTGEIIGFYEPSTGKIGKFEIPDELKDKKIFCIRVSFEYIDKEF